MGEPRKLNQLEHLRLQLARERVESAVLRTRLAEQELLSVAASLGLAHGDRVVEDGTVVPAAPGGPVGPGIP